jgi:Pilus formation protein N terminal region
MALVFGRLVLAMVLALCAVAAIAPKAAPAADLTIDVDQAMLIKLPENIATIVVGNPLIADASLQTGGIAVVTGKGYGLTNFIALDRGGAVLLEKTVEVRGTDGNNLVSVYYGMARATFSCAPYCERRITLGDSDTFFDKTLNQTTTRNSQALAISPPPSGQQGQPDSKGGGPDIKITINQNQ